MAIGIISLLDTLLSYQETLREKPTVFLSRDATGAMVSLGSFLPTFHSTRNIESGPLTGYWEPRRLATHVPLAIETPQRDRYLKSADFSLLPPHLQHIFDAGAILRTSAYPRSNYSALMYAAPTTPPSGRTGVLLYSGKPVIVIIAGKEFIVEIKGVGTPNGQNDYDQAMWRTSVFGQAARKFGGLEPDQADREFTNLEMLRLYGAQTFIEGDSPRALAMMLYDGGITYAGQNTWQGYLLRLAPGSIRASFENHAFIPPIENRAKKMAIEFAGAIAELMLLPDTRIHTGLHPENFIVTPNGYKITDFSDILPLTDFDDPYKQVYHLLDSMAQELLGGTAHDQVLFFQHLCNRLKVKYSASAGNSFVLFENLWNQFLAPRLYQARQKLGTFKTLDDLKSDISDFTKSLATVDQEICARVDRFISKMSEGKNVTADELNNTQNRLQQLQTVNHNAALAQSLFENIIFVDEEQALDFVAEQIRGLTRLIESLKDELTNYDQRMAEVEPIRYDPKALAVFDPFFFRLNIGESIRKFFQQEERLLRFMTDPLAQASLQKVKAGKKYLDSLVNPYDVVEEARNNPQFLEELVDLPYLESIEPNREADTQDLMVENTGGVQVQLLTGGIVNTNIIGMNLQRL